MFEKPNWSELEHCFIIFLSFGREIVASFLGFEQPHVNIRTKKDKILRLMLTLSLD